MTDQHYLDCPVWKHNGGHGPESCRCVNKDGNQRMGECDACGFGPVMVRPYERTVEPRGHDMLCEVCANTDTGNSVVYPGQYPEARTLKTIAWCTNRIMLEIRNQGADNGQAFER